MLETQEERDICDRYSTYSADGKVHCDKCPLSLPALSDGDVFDCACKATCHKNENGEWEYD